MDGTGRERGKHNSVVWRRTSLHPIPTVPHSPVRLQKHTEFYKEYTELYKEYTELYTEYELYNKYTEIYSTNAYWAALEELLD